MSNADRAFGWTGYAGGAPDLGSFGTFRLMALSNPRAVYDRLPGGHLASPPTAYQRGVPYQARSSRLREVARVSDAPIRYSERRADCRQELK